MNPSLRITQHRLEASTASRFFSAGARRCALAGAVVLSQAVTRPAVATEDIGPTPEAANRSEAASVVRLNEEGNALYAAGDYRRAAEQFLQAYAIEPDPNLLFNIAACYEGLGDTEAAIEKYRAFLAHPAASPEGRPRAEAAIERLTRAAAPPAVEVAPVAAPAPQRTEPGPSVDVQDPAWLPWVSLGGGAALGAVGVAFYLMGAADHDEVTRAAGFGDPDAVARLTRAEADDLVRSGDTKKAIGVGSACAGAALAAGYLAWRWLGASGPAEDAPAVEVAVTPSTTGLWLHGRF